MSSIVWSSVSVRADYNCQFDCIAHWEAALLGMAVKFFLENMNWESICKVEAGIDIPCIAYNEKFKKQKAEHQKSLSSASCL